MSASSLRAASIAAPQLKAEGFSRRRHEFVRAEANDVVSVLGFYPDPLGVP
jgi:hypothetical protein